jgi:hypothetical protein
MRNRGCFDDLLLDDLLLDDPPLRELEADDDCCRD